MPQDAEQTCARPGMMRGRCLQTSLQRILFETAEGFQEGGFFRRKTRTVPRTSKGRYSTEQQQRRPGAEGILPLEWSTMTLLKPRTIESRDIYASPLRHHVRARAYMQTFSKTSRYALLIDETCGRFQPRFQVNTTRLQIRSERARLGIPRRVTRSVFSHSTFNSGVLLLVR